MNADNWITLASLLFSIFAFAWATAANRKSNKNETRLQEFELNAHREKEEDKKKALIEAKVCTPDGRRVINVYNRGLGTAKNIRFISPEIGDGKTSHITLLDSELMPYPLLHSGGSFDIAVYLSIGYNPTAIATFIWDDEYANNNERKLVLNF